jgi:hypothetical protein
LSLGKYPSCFFLLVHIFRPSPPSEQLVDFSVTLKNANIMPTFDDILLLQHESQVFINIPTNYTQ